MLVINLPSAVIIVKYQHNFLSSPLCRISWFYWYSETLIVLPWRSQGLLSRSLLSFALKLI